MARWIKSGLMHRNKKKNSLAATFPVAGQAGARSARLHLFAPTEETQHSASAAKQRERAHQVMASRQ
jgi:hypothetical protein